MFGLADPFCFCCVELMPHCLATLVASSTTLYVCSYELLSLCCAVLLQNCACSFICVLVCQSNVFGAVSAQYGACACLCAASPPGNKTHLFYTSLFQKFSCVGLLFVAYLPHSFPLIHVIFSFSDSRATKDFPAHRLLHYARCQGRRRAVI